MMNRGYGGMGGMYGGMGGMYGGMGGMYGGMGGMYGRGMYGMGMNGEGGTLERAQMYIYQLCEIAQMVEMSSGGLVSFF